MKKLPLLLSLLLGWAFATAQSDEEMAVRKLCEAETQAWMTSDLGSYQNCWQVRPYSRMLVTTEDGKAIVIEAEQMRGIKKEMMGGFTSFSTSNWLIHASGDMAVATYDEFKTNADGSFHPTHEMRVLEKVDGSWKLVAQSIHHFKPD